MNGPPFFRVEAADWPAIVSMFEGQRWLEEAVKHDLRWWANEKRREDGAVMPGRRDLAKRWGWTEWEARKFLDSVAWDDPYHREEALPDLSHSSPAPLPLDNGPTPVLVPDSPAPLPDLSRASPSRARSIPEQDQQFNQTQLISVEHDETPSEVEARRKSKPDLPAEAWLRIVELCGKHSPGRGALSKENRKAIASILADGFTAEDAAKVWIWRATSTHKQARWLRDEGYRWSTIQAHFERYLDMACPPQPRELGPPQPMGWTEDAIWTEAYRRDAVDHPPARTSDELRAEMQRVEAIATTLKSEIANGHPPPTRTPQAVARTG